MIMSILNVQRLSGKVHFQIHAWKPLDVEGNLCTVQPLRIASEKLVVTKGSAPIYDTGSIICLPQMFQRFTFLGHSTVDGLRINVPVELGVREIPGLPVKQLSDEFVGDILRQGVS